MIYVAENIFKIYFKTLNSFQVVVWYFPSSSLPYRCETFAIFWNP